MRVVQQIPPPPISTTRRDDMLLSLGASLGNKQAVPPLAESFVNASFAHNPEATKLDNKGALLNSMAYIVAQLEGVKVSGNSKDLIAISEERVFRESRATLASFEIANKKGENYRAAALANQFDRTITSAVHYAQNEQAQNRDIAIQAIGEKNTAAPVIRVILEAAMDTASDLLKLCEQ